MSKRAVAPPDDADVVILSTKQLLQNIPITRQTLWTLCKKKKFPQPLRLTNSRLGWRLSDVRAWLAERESRPLERRAYFPKHDETSP